MAFQKRFEFRRFVKRAILITLVLALVEVLILVIFKPQKIGDTFQTPLLTKKEVKPGKITTFSSTKKKLYHPENYTPAGKDSLAKRDSIQSMPEGKAKEADLHLKQVTSVSNLNLDDQKYKTDSGIMNVNGAVKIKHVSLNRQDMTNILKRIKAERRNNSNTYNCVQLRKTVASNVNNAFKLAEFLHSSGYTIAGRLTINSDQKGIIVSAKGGCVSVIIGSL